jgi:hypothetical protein
MKIEREHVLIAKGAFAASREWKSIRKTVHAAVALVHWPPGSGSFTIYPESGKARGKGNGVTPIKEAAVIHLVQAGWQKECRWPIGERIRPGKIDAGLVSRSGLVAFEWETGNISSSHRALNKMCLGLLTGALKGGFLVVPSRRLYRFLTDRIGNIAELEPYFPLWSATPCADGALEIIVIEHDAESRDVPRISKSTAGRALA